MIKHLRWHTAIKFTTAIQGFLQKVANRTRLFIEPALNCDRGRSRRIFGSAKAENPKAVRGDETKS
jgi:hypothetical protein